METYDDTYTYTARNADDPSKVVTFTLVNNHMKVNLTDFMEKSAAVAGSSEAPDELKRQLSIHTKPILTKALESISGPVKINDVDAGVQDGKLKVVLWQRLSGLRLAPVLFNMGAIDNMDAAKDFVDEINNRKLKAPYAGKFSGPMDYWIGWIGIFVLLGFVIRWITKRQEA